MLLVSFHFEKECVELLNSHDLFVGFAAFALSSGLFKGGLRSGSLTLFLACRRSPIVVGWLHRGHSFLGDRINADLLKVITKQFNKLFLFLEAVSQ